VVGKCGLVHLELLDLSTDGGNGVTWFVHCDGGDGVAWFVSIHCDGGDGVA